MIFKVDFAKTFDLVSWDYLLEMKRELNFPEKWVAWIKACISIATVNVLVNGSPSGEFTLEMGTRQGDPLSLFLFLIVAKGLNLFTTRAVERGLLKVADFLAEIKSMSLIFSTRMTRSSSLGGITQERYVRF